MCGSFVASTPEVSGRNMYFAFLVLSLATDVVFGLASAGSPLMGGMSWTRLLYLLGDL